MTDPAYIELHAHSAYSLLRGTSPPESLVAGKPRTWACARLALTDHNNVYGAVSFQKAAQALDIQPILGAELTIGPHSTALDDEAGGRLTQVAPTVCAKGWGWGSREGETSLAPTDGKKGWGVDGK